MSDAVEGLAKQDREEIALLSEMIADACFGVSLNEEDAIGVMIRIGLKYDQAVKMIEKSREEIAPRENA